MDKFALSCPVLADELLLLAMKGEFLMSWGKVNWFTKILWVICLYMKLSPFPGVSLDVFNNKHFSPIFIFPTKRWRYGEAWSRGKSLVVWACVACLRCPNTINAICVNVSSKSGGVMSAPIQNSHECLVVSNCKYCCVFLRYLKANYLLNTFLWFVLF